MIRLPTDRALRISYTGTHRTFSGRDAHETLLLSTAQVSPTLSPVAPPFPLAQVTEPKRLP
jgi:hypothetical protein